MTHVTELSSDQLRWQCDPEQIAFETTDEIDPARMVIGQELAKDALDFGLICQAPGQNVYIRGPRGSGRMRMVRQRLAELALTTDSKRDRCYVHNFGRPDHPRLITLPPGKAEAFKKRMGRFADFIREDFLKALNREPYAGQREALREEVQTKLAKISEPLEKDLAEASMALVSMQQGPLTQTNIFPLIEGKPVPIEQLRVLIAQGKVPESVLTDYEQRIPEFQKRLQGIAKKVRDQLEQGNQQIESFNESVARQLVDPLIENIKQEFSDDSVNEFLDEVLDDIIDNRLPPSEEEQIDFSLLYGVNVVLSHKDTTTRPVVEESMPSLMNLMGTVETQWGPGGMPMSDYRGVRAGKLLQADGGFLILDIKELMAEPGAYRALMHTLRTGRLEIVPPEINFMRPTVVVQPEPIDVNIRVILIGDARSFYLLDHHDADFRELFKVLVDFDNELPREPETIHQYGAIVAFLCHEEGLLPFHRSAIARLVEHGARIVAQGNKLTARFGRIADIAREAAFLARQKGLELVDGEHVDEAIRRTKQRASLPSRKFQDLVRNGTILVQTKGEVVGQINGLAVISSGPLTYGFPARITATIGPGRAGLINIEGQAKMSGAIHTKGFHILGGLLRFLLKSQHPLAFSASLAFEQSYGGIDGDSASGAETCCLVSALTGVPIKQSISMTGAVDQHGHIQAIGGVNEKVEGFFDACNHQGLTGDQGVIIPKANADDLQLRIDVVEACRNGQFHIYAVETIHEALEVATGHPAGAETGPPYEAGTILAQAVEKADEYWRRTLVSPEKLTSVVVRETDGDESDRTAANAKEG